MRGCDCAGTVSGVISGQAAEGKNRLRQRGKGLGRSRGCVRALSQAQKSSAQTGRKGFGQGLNKGLRNTKNWATLMRAPALPCEQKAGGEEEGGGKGKKRDVENCGRIAKSFRKKVI